MLNMFNKGWRPTLAFILLFVLWESSTIIFDLPKWLLPGPIQVIQEAFSNGEFYKEHLPATIQLIGLGFIIGSTLGIFVAICLHLLPFLKDIFYPFLIISQNIPTIVLAPLLVIWFGFGMLPKLIVIALVCFFPITIALLDGFRQADPDLKHYIQMAGATKRQTFWKLEWPSAIPSLFSGLKISATYSVMGAVISEWLGASKGIGYFMTLASSSYRTDRVFVAIVMIVILSLLFFFIITSVERFVIKWKQSEKKSPI